MLRTYICLATLILFSSTINAQELGRLGIEVSAKCNPFYNYLTYPKSYYMGDIGLEPVEIDLKGARMVSFENVTGTINLWPSDSAIKPFGPDGIKGVTIITASKGMAGIRHDKKAGFLMGVFVSTTITPEENPTWYEFTGNENYTVWGFELQQPFFIGDGLTDKGEVQQILVPSGADRLYLGFADGGIGMARGYNENVGSVHTTVVLHKSALPASPKATPAPPPAKKK